jgi:CRISPR-associated protein Csh1
MIREIINFTNDLMLDFPDVMQWNATPSDGLHIFADVNEEGNWQKDTTEVYHIKKGVGNIDKETFFKILKYEQMGERVGTSMNKVFDLPAKKIFSCSPFIVSFKKKSLSDIKDSLGKYFSTAQTSCIKGDEILIQKSEVLRRILPNVLIGLNERISSLKDDEFVAIYLASVSIDDYKKAHDKYLKDKLFNTDKFNTDVDGVSWGMSGFCNGLNSKKPFLEHKTSVNKISGRISASDAMTLNKFECLVASKTLPNPLPIIIDNREINGELIKIFNEENTPLSYKEMIKRVFEKKNLSSLSNFYLLNYFKKKEIEFRDIDFVTSFKYQFDSPIVIRNILGIKDFSEEKIHNIFDFERLVISPVFNNSLVKIKEDKYTVSYFGDIDSNYVSGGEIMYSLIMKYRKAVYDYIYKAQHKAISSIMFEDMMSQSILSNIRKDEVKTIRFSWNNQIKHKLNIWFSLYNLFNKNKENMESKLEELIIKSKEVAKGEAHINSCEEFAFAAGQIVSFLIDRSVATNKTYSLLEPYLQKVKSGQLQDAIAQSIAVYKHDVSTYKGAFHALASNVLTYDSAIDMKPLLKFFLAGCFADCVIYSKKNSNINE